MLNSRQRGILYGFAIGFATVCMLISLQGCGSAKLVVKNCEKAGNEDLFICDRI